MFSWLICPNVLLAYLSDDGLPTSVDMDMFDSHSLLTFDPITAQCFCLVGKGAHEFRRPIHTIHPDASLDRVMEFAKRMRMGLGPDIERIVAEEAAKSDVLR